MINTENRAMYDCIPILVSQHIKLVQDRFVSCKSPLTVPAEAQVTESYKISSEFLKELIAKVETSKFLSKQQKSAILAELKAIV